VKLNRAACERITLLLPDYMAAALRDRRARSLEQHLAACAHCQRELQWLRRLEAALSKLAEYRAPPGLEQRVMSAVAAARHLRERNSRAETATFVAACAAGPAIPALFFAFPTAIALWLPASVAASIVIRKYWPGRKAQAEG
jgi:anti-sigma factor RsiW